MTDPIILADHAGVRLAHGKPKVNGVEIHYAIGGVGEPVFLLHGVPKTMSYWRHVVPLLTPHYTVVVVDNRGFGGSQRPLTGYDTATMASDVAELETHLGFDRFRIAGEDWGAAIAYAVAAFHRPRVQQLALRGSALGGLRRFTTVAWCQPARSPSWQDSGMERVLGIGGYFLRAADPAALSAWYRDCLGLDADQNGLWRQEAGQTVFATFESETDYFGSRAQQTMLNFRVRDLDAMLAQLRAKGADVAKETQDMEGVGRFGWVTDPEGNRVELWQPA